MQEVNITKLRNHLPSYLEQAHKGKEIWVTSRGQVVARLLPPLDLQASACEQLQQLREHCTIGDVISPIKEKCNAEDGHS